MTDEAAGKNGDAPDRPKRKQEPTEYVILQLDEAGTWRKEDKAIKAQTVQAAIAAFAGDEGGTFVAIPSRSWKPYTLKVEHIPKRSFEEVKA